MTTTQSFERQRRDELHQESMAMLAAERAAVDGLTQSYEQLALAVRAAYSEMDEFSAREEKNNAGIARS